MLLEATSVEISGATPGREIVLLTVWREAGGGGTEVTILDETLVDEDGDGVVRWRLDRETPDLSIWVAIDLETGDRIVQSPEGFESRRPELRPGRFGAAQRRAELDLPRAEVIAIRPKTGAFRATLGDGTDEDEDGEVNGRIALTAQGLQRAVRRPPQADEPDLPEHFEPGDIVLAIDPRTLQVSEVEVPGAGPTEPTGGAS